MSKTALIVGVDGQDGKLMFEYLSKKGYTIIGVGQKTMRCAGVRTPTHFSITESLEVRKIIQKYKPAEVYFLAAYHHSSQDAVVDARTLYVKSNEIHVAALLNFLEAMRKYSPKAKLFYAASSLIFGSCDFEVQNEQTPFRPDSMYGITKLEGLRLCRLYRDLYGVFASVGILYNHESVYRSEAFVSMKIIKAALAIKNGLQKQLLLGDLSAAIDWGYAPDYVEAMHSMLQVKKSDDFIVASGTLHTVQNLVEVAFGELGLDWKKYVSTSKQVITRQRKPMRGNATKLTKSTGWKPKTSFKKMIATIIKQLTVSSSV